MDIDSRTKQIIGIFLVVLAMALFSLKDSFVKMLDGYYSPVFIMWAQMLFASIFWTPVITAKYGVKSLIPENKILHESHNRHNVSCSKWRQNVSHPSRQGDS